MFVVFFIVRFQKSLLQMNNWRPVGDEKVNKFQVQKQDGQFMSRMHCIIGDS